jgi:hypothetical protein
MLRSLTLAGGAFATGIALLFLAGCSPSKPVTNSDTSQKPATTTSTDSKGKSKTTDSEDHGHKTGSHGGMIVSLGRDSYHVEAIVTGKGEIRLHTLGNDESRVIDIESQTLTAYVKPSGASDAETLEIKPQPQPGDAAGKASLFSAQLPEKMVGKNIDVTIPNITIGGERFRMGFSNKAEQHGAEAMPGKVADEAEKKLYLTPGGIYSVADIEANGKVTASQKFAGFMASHDLKPKVGDKICPVTLTKANPECAWIVNGKKYEFCCPPCVDEFVTLAKTKPEEIKAPEDYVKRDPAAQSETK